MEFTNILGLMAGLLTTCAFIPQVVKTWKSRHTRDISLGMFAIFSGGVFLWLWYGVTIDSMPIIAANAVTLMLSLILLVLKLKYK